MGERRFAVLLQRRHQPGQGVVPVDLGQVGPPRARFQHQLQGGPLGQAQDPQMPRLGGVQEQLEAFVRGSGMGDEEAGDAHAGSGTVNHTAFPHGYG